jgi:hypothetical protein
VCVSDCVSCVSLYVLCLLCCIHVCSPVNVCTCVYVHSHWDNELCCLILLALRGTPLQATSVFYSPLPVGDEYHHSAATSVPS